MGTKESMKKLPILNSLEDIELNKDNRNNYDHNNSSQNNDLFKRAKIRKNAHTVKFLPDNKKNDHKMKTKKPIMTEEQRNLLKTFLKENVKENKKAIAKNLASIFLESNQNNKKKLNSQQNNININGQNKEFNNIDPALKRRISIKTNEKKKKFNSKNSFKKMKISRHGTSLIIRPNKFIKEYKKEYEDEAKNGNKNIGKKKSGILIPTPAISYNNINKINFTALLKSQSDLPNENSKNNFSTYRDESILSNLEKKTELDEKKGIVFQRKSFREFLETDNKKDYKECLKLINSTSILSHLDDPDKSLLIQSLKIKNLKKDHCILKANEKSSIIYFIKEGLIQFVDDEGKCIKTLAYGENFGEKEILMDIKKNYNIITITDCLCYSISIRSLKKIFGNQFRNFIFYNFMKSAFDCSKLFQNMSIFYIGKIFKFFNIINLDKDNVAFPIGHKKSSKFVIIIDGNLINSKSGEIIGRPLDILFEEELLSLNEDKITYALNPSNDVLFFEGDTKEILKYLKCNSFDEVLNKNIIFENLSKIILFKSFSQLKLYKLIDLIHIEKYKDGEEIIKEGQIGEKFYIVKTGQVEVFRKNIYLRTLNSMEYFGERALLTNEVRSATVIAKNNVELYSLDKESFNKNLSDMMVNYLNISLYLHDETVSLNDLLYIKSIGKGNYGFVSLVMNEKTKFPYAIKAINKNHINAEKLHENIQLEKNILLKIDHPFIVKLVKCLKDEKNIYFLMEYLKGKELFDVIRDIGLLNKEQTNFFIASMMIAVNYLHERKIIHRDIKPENIIVEKNGYIKLIDFGTAKEIEDRTKTIIGTPHYMAPEIIMGGGYSFQVDYWSISICMYEFICGGVPFGEKEEDPMDVYFAIINNHLSFPHKYISVSKEFKNIMKKMLDKNPTYRLTNFYSIKNHAWFKDFKWDELINLNLKAPYLPIIPYSSFDFDEQCKPKFDNEKQHFQKYVDYIQKKSFDYEIEEKIPKEKLIEYKRWFDKF